jgi:hypothetical protein
MMEGIAKKLAEENNQPEFKLVESHTAINNNSLTSNVIRITAS